MDGGGCFFLRLCVDCVLLTLFAHADMSTSVWWPRLLCLQWYSYDLQVGHGRSNLRGREYGHVVTDSKVSTHLTMDKTMSLVFGTMDTAEN